MKARERAIPDAIDSHREQGPHGVPAIPGNWLRQLALSIVTNGARANPIIAVVASLPREGTTTIVVNLAQVLEQELQRRVAVVDICLTAPTLHAVYGVPLAPGLAEVLRAGVPLREAVQMSERGSFAVLPAGEANPREQALLLTNARLPGVLEQLRREAFDVCLLDCPSVLAAPEAAMVARHADTTYCVVRAEQTRWGTVERATNALLTAGCNLGGVVLNQVPFHIPGFIYRLL
jgi:Mrp family chromosome partitioning ATPase